MRQNSFVVGMPLKALSWGRTQEKS